MSGGFTKLVPEIVQSSIWNESAGVRVVWITLLAVKDETGYARGDVNTIARLANVTLEIAREALEKFQQPDPSSHTPDNEGRRIQAAPGGWIVLNHSLYRMRDHKAEHAEYVRKWRASKDDVIECDSQVSHPSASASVSASSPEGGCKGGVELPFNSDTFKTAWQNFKEHRRANKCVMTPHAQKLALKKLPAEESEAIRWIEHAIEKGWRGIYEPDKKPTFAKPNMESFREAKAIPFREDQITRVREHEGEER